MLIIGLIMLALTNILTGITLINHTRRLKGIEGTLPRLCGGDAITPEFAAQVRLANRYNDRLYGPHEDVEDIGPGDVIVPLGTWCRLIEQRKAKT